MRILSINLLAMSDKMRSRESQQSIDPVGVMKKVRESLQALIWSVQSNSAAYATIVLALVTGSGEARAQERPTWGRPDQVVAAVTVPASPWASIARPTETTVVDVTSDGRKFASLSEIDVKKLPRSEKEKYYTWLEIKENAAIIARKQEWRELDGTIVARKQEWRELDLAIEAQRTLNTLLTAYGSTKSLPPAERRQAIEALRNPRVPQDVKEYFRRQFGINENV